MNGSRAQQPIGEEWRLRLAVGFVVLVFLLGGSARADVMSLVLLRPLAVLVLAAMLAWTWRAALDEARSVVMLFVAVGALVMLHLVPLPPAVWMALPGRDLAIDAFRVTGTAPTWMPISLSPIEGWNQLFALAVPAAGGLSMVWAGRGATRPIAVVLLALMLVSAMLGFLQSIGPSRSALFLYRITNEGSAVGLFANRNHQAMLLACFFPLLAAWASTVTGSAERRRAQIIVALAVAVTIVPLLFVTGSRAGLLLGAVGIAIGWFIFQRPGGGFRVRNDVRARRILIFGGAGAALALVFIAALSARATAITRIIDGDEATELRLGSLPYLLDAIWTYFPLGSGAGSFVPVYKTIEPNHLLSPAYFNHAHNDVIEVALEYGLPGIILILLALVAWGAAVGRLVRHRRRRKDSLDACQLFGWAGAGILAILGLASIADYPLRVPSLAMFATIASIWLTWAVAATRSTKNKDGISLRDPLGAHANLEAK